MFESSVAEGEAKGRTEGIRATAKKLLLQNVDLAIIQAATDLSESEILALKNT